MAAPIIFGMLLVTGPARQGLTAEKNYIQYINCDIQNRACVQRLSGCEIEFNITPKPVKAMTDLAFYVKITGKTPHAPPVIDLGMPGMTMGPNRIRLEPQGQNAFAGRGVIVRCPSGRTVWRATVVIPEVGGVDFIFNVIY